MTNEELLKRLAQCCYIWPRKQGGFPNICVTKGYGDDPSAFASIGGEVIIASMGQNKGKLTWVIRHDEAKTLMKELLPYVNDMRRKCINTWL